MHEREQGMITGLVILLLVLTLGFYVLPRRTLSRQSRGRHAGGLRRHSCSSRSSTSSSSASPGSSRVSRGPCPCVPSWRFTCMPVCWVRSSVSSTVGIRSTARWASLTAMMIVVVLVASPGRYLMKAITTDMRQQQQLLAGLRGAYDRVAAELAQDAGQTAALRPFVGFFSRLGSILR